jgi:hypothetical protein
MTRKLLIITIVGVFLLTSLALATDLKWRSPIEISPAAPNSGDTVTFRCKLKSGGGPADSILVEGRIDGVKVWDHTYPHFDTDELTWVEFTWVATGGTHTVAFVIDPHVCSVDSNPANNTRSVSFDVTGGGGDPEDPGPTETGPLTSTLKLVTIVQARIHPGMFNPELICDRDGNQDKTVDVAVPSIQIIKIPSPYQKDIVFDVKNNGEKCLRSLRYFVVDSFSHVIVTRVINPEAGKNWAIYGNKTRKIKTRIGTDLINQYLRCSKIVKLPSKRISSIGSGSVIKSPRVPCSKISVIVDPIKEVIESDEANNSSAEKTIYWPKGVDQ